MHLVNIMLNEIVGLIEYFYTKFIDVLVYINEKMLLRLAQYLTIVLLKVLCMLVWSVIAKEFVILLYVLISLQVPV